MEKTRILWTIFYAIILIVFNAVFFVVGIGGHTSATWISYAFIHFAYLMLLLSPMFVRNGKSAAVYRFPIYAISTAYFLVELLAGSAIIMMSLDNYRAALVVQLIFAGVYGLMLVSNMIANEHSADNEEERQHEMYYVKEASVRVKTIWGNTTDKELKKKTEKIYDVLYSSPVKSHPSLADIEVHIFQAIEALEKAFAAKDDENASALADALLSAVNERNMRLQSMH